MILRFDTRVRHVEFPVPDAECRERIWRQHLPARLPLAHDVSLAELSSKTDGFVGREIRRTVVEAATIAVLSGAQVVSRPDLISAIERLRASKDAIYATRAPAG
jgi:ATP-dependent 26S proteasome regulatory subunit